MSSHHSYFLRWTWYEDVCADSPMVASTNSSEGLNHGFNMNVSYCHNTAQMIAEIKRFKVEQLERYLEITATPFWHPKRRKEVVERHEKLTELVQTFIDYGVVNQVFHLFEIAETVGKLMINTKNK